MLQCSFLKLVCGRIEHKQTLCVLYNLYKKLHPNNRKPAKIKVDFGNQYKLYKPNNFGIYGAK